MKHLGIIAQIHINDGLCDNDSDSEYSVYQEEISSDGGCRCYIGVKRGQVRMLVVCTVLAAHVS